MHWSKSVNGKRRLFWVLVAVCAAASVPPAVPAQAPPTPRFVVVLDAAHGGDDPGARRAYLQLLGR